MTTFGQSTYESIRDDLLHQHKTVTIGKMMSAPAIKYRNKVFAFYYEDTMVFRLGRDYDIKAVGVQEHSLLSPFKTKPPMQDWFCVPYAEHEHWAVLAQKALALMQAKLD